MYGCPRAAATVRGQAAAREREPGAGERRETSTRGVAAIERLLQPFRRSRVCALVHGVLRLLGFLAQVAFDAADGVELLVQCSVLRGYTVEPSHDVADVGLDVPARVRVENGLQPPRGASRWREGHSAASARASAYDHSTASTASNSASTYRT